jgi:hypothetical protein
VLETLRQSLAEFGPTAKTLDNLAWLLATCPDNTVRNGPVALDLARQVCSQHPRPRYLATLAAAHAEVGDFGQALSVANQALNEIGHPASKLAIRLRRMVRGFQTQEPVRAPYR